MAKKVKEVKIEEKVEVIEVAKKVKKPNAWLAHVKKYRADNPDCSYKDCLKNAKTTYKKGGAVKEETHKMPDGKVMKGATHKEKSTPTPTPAPAPVELTKSPAPEKKMKKVKKVKKVKTME